MPWSRGMWNNNIMAKKQFNFAQMAGTPVVEDANETMTKAFEPKEEQQLEAQAVTPSVDNQPTATPQTPQGENPDVATVQSESEQASPMQQQYQPQQQEPQIQEPLPVVTAPIHRTMLTQQLRTEQVMKMDEVLRDEWMQYLAVYAGSISIGANVQIPEGIDDRLEAIKKRMRGVPGAVKMQKKNLILLALWEFVEKYDRA